MECSRYFISLCLCVRVSVSLSVFFCLWSPLGIWSLEFHRWCSDIREWLGFKYQELLSVSFLFCPSVWMPLLVCLFICLCLSASLIYLWFEVFGSNAGNMTFVVDWAWNTKNIVLCLAECPFLPLCPCLSVCPSVFLSLSLTLGVEEGWGGGGCVSACLSVCHYLRRERGGGYSAGVGLTKHSINNCCAYAVYIEFLCLPTRKRRLPRGLKGITIQYVE